MNTCDRWLRPVDGTGAGFVLRLIEAADQSRSDVKLNRCAEQSGLRIAIEGFTGAHPEPSPLVPNEAVNRLKIGDLQNLESFEANQARKSVPSAHPLGAGVGS